MSSPLDAFQKKHDRLVAIDSDGCAFDSMEIKHKECFIPNFVRVMGLQAVSKYAREACEFTNLYSKTRGANRFPAYLLALDLLEQRPEAVARGAKIPKLQGVRDWVKRESKLSSGSCRAEADKTGDADLKRAAEWSAAVDASIKETVHDVPPFPGVRESLERLAGKVDMIVCSATPTPALEKEWREHGIDGFVSAICGQEVGSKAEILAVAKAKGYAADHILMVGDAPGDMKAARSVGASFQPINPGHEDASWAAFLAEGIERFLSGTFVGPYEAALVAEFDRHLPEHPPWKA